MTRFYNLDYNLKFCGLYCFLVLALSNQLEDTSKGNCIHSDYAQGIRVVSRVRLSGKEENVMSGKAKSKTDVSARSESRNAAKLCSICGNKVDVVMSVSPTGKKSMRRLCCEN